MEEKNRVIIPQEEEIIRIHDYLADAHKTPAGVLTSPGYVPSFCENYLSEEGITPVIAFILSRLTKGHYFQDGNKRTAYFTGKYTALRNGFDFNGSSPEDTVNEMIQLSTLDDESSRKYAQELVERDLIKLDYKLDNLSQFERLVLKNIAVSTRLSAN